MMRITLDVNEAALARLCSERAPFLSRESRNDPDAVRRLCDYLVNHLEHGLETAKAISRHKQVEHELFARQMREAQEARENAA